MLKILRCNNKTTVNISQYFHCLYSYPPDIKLLLSVNKSSKSVGLDCDIAYTSSHQMSKHCSQKANLLSVILNCIIAYTPSYQMSKYCSQLTEHLNLYFSLSLLIHLSTRCQCIALPEQIDYFHFSNRCQNIALNLQIVKVSNCQPYHCIYTFASDVKILLSIIKSCKTIVLNIIVAYTPSTRCQNTVFHDQFIEFNISQHYHCIYTFSPDVKILFSIKKLSKEIFSDILYIHLP